MVLRIFITRAKDAELRFRLCVFLFFIIFCLCRDVMHMRHDVPEIKMKDDLIKITDIFRTNW